VAAVDYQTAATVPVDLQAWKAQVTVLSGMKVVARGTVTGPLTFTIPAPLATGEKIHITIPAGTLPLEITEAKR